MLFFVLSRHLILVAGFFMNLDVSKIRMNDPFPDQAACPGVIWGVYLVKPRHKAPRHALKKILGIKPSKTKPRPLLCRVGRALQIIKIM